MENNTAVTEADLLEFARSSYAAEIDALACEYKAAENPETDFFINPSPELTRAAAEINVSRRHEPEAWKRIDEADHAEMIAANADDM